MAANNFTILPFSTASQGPRILFLSTTEDYATITAPGYLNTAGTVGVSFQSNDFIFAQYNDGLNNGLFNVSITDGVFTMSVYNPNSNSFTFTNLQFVAKGGSNGNVGNQMGLPKLTIAAAISALALGPSQRGTVWVLDGAEYQENLVLPFNISIYAPNSSITAANASATITINDSGQNTLASITCAQVANFGAGLCINLLGAQSNLFIDSKIVQGDMYIEGGFIDGNIAQVDSTVHVASTGMFGPNIFNAISFTLIADLGSTIAGNIQSIISPGVSNNDVYGNQTFKDHVILQTPPSTETTGRTVAIADSNTTIVYNNASQGTYTFPQTTSVAIPIGSKIDFIQLGLGAIAFSAGSGVTLISYLGGPIQSNGPGSVSAAYKYTDTIWIISGNLIGP